MTRFWRGIRARVALLVFLVSSLVLVVFGLVVSRQVLDFHRREFDSAFYNLVIDASQEVEYIAEGIPTPPQGGFDFGRRSLPFPEPLSLFQIRGADGAILYQSPNLPELAVQTPNQSLPQKLARIAAVELPWTIADWRALVTDEVAFRELTPSQIGIEAGSNFRMIAVPLRQDRVFRGVLQVAVPTDEIEKERQHLNQLFALMMPIMVLGLAIGSYLIAGSALRPLRELIERTRAISPTDLSIRLPQPRTGDEIAELSRTLNGLLSRLQSSFDSQEQFVADASHQLKTPLAVMQGEIEILRGKTLSMEEMSAFLDSAHEEVRHLSKLVAGLLLLARISALPEASLVRTAVRLDELLIGLLERFKAVMEKRQIKCRFQVANLSDDSAGYEIQGDEDLLRSLFETLVENAIKYSPDGGLIEVLLDGDAKAIRVRVSDQGSGIPEDKRSRVFERFYRADTKAQGFGLGLTIAQQIAIAHGARIEIQDRPGWGGSIVVEMSKNSSPLHI